MKLTDLKEISDNINLDEYLYLYNYVRDNMEHTEWLGTFTLEELLHIKKVKENNSDIIGFIENYLQNNRGKTWNR